jgi:AraC-like DNA-binding protein/mannose-6-phosphate isomerase-like protein (cupin superfamily)
MLPRRSPLTIELPPHGVLAWESRHDYGFRMTPERHPFAEIFYVLDGTGWFVIQGARHPCRAGDVVAVPPRLTHHIEDAPKAPLTLYGICIAPHLLAHDSDVLAALPAGRLGVGPRQAAQVRAGLRRLLFEQTRDQPGSRTLVLGLALQFVAALVPRPPAPAPPAPGPRGDLTTHCRAVEHYLAELPTRFYEPATIDRVAADLGMSRRCFTRLFRAAAGCSWSRYVEAARIDYACRLLRETRRGVASIAFECGYEELSSFYRAFKRRQGVPPQRWRTAAG